MSFKIFIFSFTGLLLSLNLVAQVAIYDSGGPLHPEMSVYDVKHYLLAIDILPEEKKIKGIVTMTVDILQNTSKLAFNLDTVFDISKIELKVHEKLVESKFLRESGLIYLESSTVLNLGDEVKVTTFYAGKPLAANIKPGWSDGFFWDKTASGDHWISNVTVLNGADIWWPCKDHPADEPKSVDMLFTVPNPLIVASNGRLEKVLDLPGGKHKTYHWHVSTPINNYSITINAAPYKILDTTIQSISGEMYPVYFYVLPENYEKGKQLFPQFIEHLNFFEKMLGPYPFRKDKYGVAETSYFGMENQTIIAYGNNYTNNKYGFDNLHYHELAHEWFANMVTCSNWKDWWIHEGLATYMESLYVEYLHGREAYHEYADMYFERMKNEKPVSPEGFPSTREQYISDVYSKGAAIMHNSRYLLGDKAFFKTLRRLAYPDKSMEAETSGVQCRFSSTEEFIQIFEEEFGKKLGWYFLSVLRYANLPKLRITKKKKKLILNWETDLVENYAMPIEVDIDGNTQRLKMKRGKGKFRLSKSLEYKIDPNNWLLKDIVME